MCSLNVKRTEENKDKRTGMPVLASKMGTGKAMESSQQILQG